MKWGGGVEVVWEVQRLSRAAVAAPSKRAATRLVHEAFAMAERSPDRYHAAIAATWPLKVLRMQGNEKDLVARTNELLGGLDELNCVSRLWVLSNAIGAVCGGPKDLFSKVVTQFTNEARMCHSWRTPRLIFGVIGVVDAIDPTLSAAMLDVFTNPNARARAERHLAAARAIPITVDHCRWPHL
jgi:hypothetical protein